MKRNLISMLLVAIFAGAVSAQTYERVITGVVRDKETRQKLANVNIAVAGSNVGTVTNADGVFSLKLSAADQGRGVEVSHLGYRNVMLRAEELVGQEKRLTVWLVPSSLTLKELNVFGGNPRELVEQAIRKIPANYAPCDNLFSAFYRETIQKGRRYIGVSEAVMDVYKTDYRSRQILGDKVQIQKGRRLASQKRSDTLAVKIAGGPNIPVFLDVVKNGGELLDEELLPCYRFTMQLPISIDDRMQYVVAFEPQVALEQPLYKGVLYIDQESLAFTRAEFELDLSDKDKVIRHILKKRPSGLRFKPQSITYLVTYRQQEGRTYLNYLRNDIRFKCDWKKRLFSSGFTTTTEMVMVDRQEHPSEGIRWKDAFRQSGVFYDVVEEYWNVDFWHDYNIIEPTESLESAVKRLKKKR